MPRFAANLSTLFTEYAFFDRFAAAAEAGFAAVEIQFPYAFEKEQIASELTSNDLELVLHNLPPGNIAAGDRGLTCLPDRIDEFRHAVTTAIDYATALHCPRLNSLIGVPPEGCDGALVHETLINNLRFAANALATAGLHMTIEPVNHFDNPGYLLNRSAEAVAVIEEVGAANLTLQFDCYHMQMMEGDLARSLKTHLNRIGHIQIADNPGRHEPGTGEINYAFLFGWLDEIGYGNWVGVEYHPRTNTADGLAWIRPWL
ncbi:MAG: hydroxypyruvate isomerase [Proteobacteria bacterium]|nr:hydroxypyruvate isomerase [Pseudomonadota bacterium]